MAKEVDINKDELKAIISQVSASLDPLLKKEAEKAVAAEALAKAHPGEAIEAEKKPDASETETPPTEEAPKVEAETPPPEVPAPADEGELPIAPEETVEEPGAEPTPEEMQAAFEAMPDEMLQAMYMCIKTVLVGRMAVEAPAPEAEVEAPVEEPAMKGEIKDDEKANGENPLHKSEIESLNATIAEQKTQLEGLVKALAKRFEVPMRKSITSTSELPPTAKPLEKLEKSEVRVLLRKAIDTKRLSSTDQDAVASYYHGNVGVEGIAHIIKDVK